MYLRKVVWIVFAASMVIPMQSIVFAESTYGINIPSGSAYKSSPFHWSSEKDGNASGFIEIIVNDTIHWKNDDTAIHTVVSGNSANWP